MSLTLRDAQHLSWKTFKKFESMSKMGSSGFDSAAEFVRKANEVVGKIKLLQSADSSGQGE